MAEMTPEREASEIVAEWLALFMPYETKPTVTLRHVLEARIADALRAERDEVAAYAAHEEQTHRILGAILGVDDSLEACARRMKERAERAEELLRRVPQAVDFLIQHRTLLHLRDTLRSLADQADSAIHDAVEPSRLADIERERDVLTREVERSRETLLEWQKRDGKLVYDDEDNGPTLCVCEWAADREAVLRAGHGHVCTLVREALGKVTAGYEQLSGQLFDKP